MDIDELLDGLSDSDEGSTNLQPETSHTANSPSEDFQGAAEITVDVDSRLEPLGNRLRTCYSPRFPELETLVPDLREFTAVIAVLGPNLVVDPSALAAVVGKQRAMVVQMSLADSPGRILTSQEWETVESLIETAKSLFEQRESAMAALADDLTRRAPNLLSIVQLPTAVRLVAYRGGLKELAATSSANLVSLGAPKTQLGHTLGQPRRGFVYGDAIVKSVPPQHKLQAVRMVCAKVVLAARVDLAHGSPDGAQGALWRSQIMNRIEKLAVAPPSATDRALPVPEDKKSKKRGGRRARRLKQQLMPTEKQRQRNRMAFGKASADYDV